VIGGAGTFATAYTYDALDRVVTMAYPGGEVVHHTYNAQGLVDSVYGDATYVQSTTYDASGRVEQRKLGNDVLRTTYVYYPWTTANGLGRLWKIETGPGSDPTLRQHLEYEYDGVGNVTQIVDHKAGPQTQTFTYDALDRLLSGSATGGSNGLYGESYTYDPTGNLLSKGGVSYTCPAPGPGSVRPHAVTSLSTGWTYQYDANGNVTQRVEGGTTYVQEFDAENRLQRVTVGGQVSEFSYDGDGNRVRKVAGGQTTVYVGNYYEKQGTTVTTYYYANGQRVAMRVDDGSQEVV